ncbi:MAG: AraC family transcriptional regulator [Ruminococcaceae bacterium]|nr:AraC family transcriptional regulator [Oscillospiraceae bacterium]
MDNVLFSHLEKVQPVLFLGDFTECEKDWGYHNIRPSYNKFYYVTEGEAYINIEGKEYVARPGQLFLLPCNSKQTYYHTEAKHLVKYWIHCSFNCGEKDLLEMLQLPHYIEVTSPEYVEKLFEKLLEGLNDTSVTGKLYQKSCLLELLAYYFDHVEEIRKDYFRDERIMSVLKYIDQNYQRRLTIQELSDVVHLHPNYFINLFHDVVDMTPMEYVNNVRINRAKELMQKAVHKIPINEVASQIGFTDVHYFSRLFKKKTGYTPTEYMDTLFY